MSLSTLQGWCSLPVVVLLLCSLGMMFQQSYATHNTGVCYRSVWKNVATTHYRSVSYSYRYSCGFLWLSRCRGTRSRTEAYTVYGYQYVSEFGCCTGYHLSGHEQCTGITIGLQVSNTHVGEDVGSISACASVQVPNSSVSIPNVPYRVNLEANGYSALSGSDFAALDTRVTLYSSSRTQCVKVNIIQDYIYESTESFTVDLSLTPYGLPSYVTLSPTQSNVYINDRNRVRIGFEKELYFMEDDACTTLVCVAIHQPLDVSHLPSSDIYIVELRTDSSSDAGQLITLTLSEKRQCINVEVDHALLPVEAVISEHRMPSYVHLEPAVTTIEAREDVVIGFEETDMTVYEDAGSTSICVKILQPSSLGDLVEDEVYPVNVMAIATDNSRDIVPVDSLLTFNKQIGRLCTSLDVIHDHIHEGEEQFVAALSNENLPSYVKLNPNTLNIRVLNVKRNLSVGFDVEEMVVPENVGDIPVCVTATAAIDGMVTMSLDIVDIFTAVDDVSLPNSKSSSLLQFDADHVVRCVVLTVVDDDVCEENETVILTLDVVSMTHPFYMVVQPLFLKITITDNDAVVIGFESPLMEVTKSTLPQSVKVCISTSEEPGTTSNTFLLINTQDGLADDKCYLPIINQFFIIPPATPSICTNILIKPISTSDRAVRTFSVSLSMLWDDPLIILSPKTLLIKLMNEVDEPPNCALESSSCEYECSDPSLWTDWVPDSSVMDIAKDVCFSEQTVLKTRYESVEDAECSEKGQFCILSQQEKLIRSFNLGISQPSLVPFSSERATGGNCNQSEVMTCQSPALSSSACESARPEVCNNRSVLYILDSSSNVGEEDFGLMTSAVGELTRHMCGDIEVAVMKFNDLVYLDFCFECITSNRFNLREYISNVTYQFNGGTANLNNTIECIGEDAFREECGDHSETDCIDIVLVIDAQSLPSDRCDDAMSSLKRRLPLRDSICNKSRVYAIGIGSDMDTSGLKCIADSVDDKDTIFTFDSYLDFKTTVTQSVQHMFVNRMFCSTEKDVCDAGRIDTSCFK